MVGVGNAHIIMMITQEGSIQSINQKNFPLCISCPLHWRIFEPFRRHPGRRGKIQWKQTGMKLQCSLPYKQKPMEMKFNTNILLLWTMNCGRLSLLLLEAKKLSEVLKMTSRKPGRKPLVLLRKQEAESENPPQTKPQMLLEHPPHGEEGLRLAIQQTALLLHHQRKRRAQLPKHPRLALSRLILGF